MIVFSDLYNPKLPEMLKAGSIGVLRTDTMYAIVARASDQTAVERVYAAKNRDPRKPCIVLIADTDQLYDPLPESLNTVIDQYWPGRNAFVVPAISAPDWLTRNGGTIAYRLPDSEPLRQLLRQTGPLIVPSASFDDQKPAESIAHAQGYFGDSIDFCVDGGIIFDKDTSSIYSVTSNGDIEQIS